jgi:hypothetical protein
MPDGRAVVEVDLAVLAASVERLEMRIAALERALGDSGLAAGAAVPGVAADAPQTSGAAALPEETWSVPGAVTDSGRTLIALGGAYLVRALTEAGVVSPASGIVAGLAYAGLWMALSMRASRRALPVSATFHGLTAALVGFPLLWETTARLALVSPSVSAAVLGLFTMSLLLAARRAQIESVAWFGAMGGTVTALALAVTTGAFLSYTLVVAGVGIATLWLGYLDDWVFIRWPVAVAANLMVVIVTIRAVDPDVPPATLPTLALQLSVLGLYLGSFVARTLALGREVILFEVVQSAAAMAVCFGGALWVLHVAGVSADPLGVAALVLGAGSYAFAFSVVEPRGERLNVAFFTSLALAFALAGIAIAVPAGTATIVMGALALLGVEWARRSRRLTLAVHGTVLAAVMAGFAGLLGLASSGLTAAAADSWPRPEVMMMVALVTVGVCGAWPLPVSPECADRPAARAFRLARLSWLVWVWAGAVTALAVPLVTAPPGSGADAALVATCRTVILVGFAAAIVVLPSRQPMAVRVWVSYALLGAIALKLLTEDLPRGRPATLFVALAVYGAALIGIPRKARQLERAAPTLGASATTRLQ